MASDPRLSADESGVWREDVPGQPFCLPWEQITGVVGYRLDCITEVVTVIELDHPSGHWLEVHAGWAGFPEVVAAIGSKLPGISPEWFEEVRSRDVSDPPVEVWRRE